VRRLAVGAVAAVVLAVPATAVAGVFGDGEYGGKVDRDPSQFISFDVVRDDGKRYVTHIELVAAELTCADSAGDGPQSGSLEGRFKIKHGEFEGSRRYDFSRSRRGSGGLSYSIEGEFVRERKVRGEYRLRLRGGVFDPCVTGKLPFVARKPAPEPPTQKPQA
jgi:hypothetical protein